jgi:heme exporter protein B
VPGFSIGNYAIFITAIILGTFGLASASTIIAAIVAKASTKGTLYPVLAFPILLPLLLTLINVTKLAAEGVAFNEAIGEFQVLIAYGIAITAISYILFDFIWKE